MTLKVVSASNAANANNNGNANNNTASNANHVAAIIPLRSQWLTTYKCQNKKPAKRIRRVRPSALWQ
ncbi:hypothetical protein SAMN04487852_103271 [Prevotella sp. tf2-5]|nr:hypothetical protein SAMN04487852_103271 [Prevotella sp. tf2-5]